MICTHTLRELNLGRELVHVGLYHNTSNYRNSYMAALKSLEEEAGDRIILNAQITTCYQGMNAITATVMGDEFAPADAARSAEVLDSVRRAISRSDT